MSPTFSVLGSALAGVDYAQAVEQVREWATEKRRPYAVAAANTHLVTLARHDPQFGEVMQKFDLILPDGMPLVWCMNRSGAALKDRVYGPTFMLRTLAAVEGRHFFLGGTEELLEALQTKLRAKFPELQVAGSHAPPFGPWEREHDLRIMEKIASSKADYVWVGLGCPKQEQWIARLKEELPPAVYLGVGAAFAFHAGRVRQAPLFMQRLGLEWLFRLLMEPRRLWKRFGLYNSLFIFYLLKGKRS